MAKKVKETFASKPLTELAKLLLEFRTKLWQSKADVMAGKVKSVKEARLIRKDIARVMTAMKATSSK